FVLRRVDRLVRLDICVAFAVAVGVENERRPALRSHLVAGLLEHLAIEPAEYTRAGDPAAGPQRVVSVLGEDQMVRREAGADQGELAGRRVVHRQLTTGFLQRKYLGRGVVRSGLAEIGVRRRADP